MTDRHTQETLRLTNPADRNNPVTVESWPPGSFHSVSAIRATIYPAIMKLYPRRRFGTAFQLSSPKPDGSAAKNITWHLSELDLVFEKLILQCLWSPTMDVEIFKAKNFGPAHNLLNSTLPMDLPYVCLKRLVGKSEKKVSVQLPLTWKRFWAAVHHLFPEMGDIASNAVLIAPDDGHKIGRAKSFPETIAPGPGQLDDLRAHLTATGACEFVARIHLVWPKFSRGRIH